MGTNTTTTEPIKKIQVKKESVNNKKDWAESELYKHVFETSLREYMDTHNKANVNMGNQQITTDLQ